MERKISVTGLGYVGLPVAVAFGKQYPVVAFDSNAARIQELQSGYDATSEVDKKVLDQANLLLTDDASALASADFHIVTVPTPIDKANQPDLGPLLQASESVARQLKKGDMVVYESTVYPGATEEECIPALEYYSGLKNGQDFFVGYSPERINPGDKEHTFGSIQKVVSGQDANTLDVISTVYAEVVEAGVFKASSIKVAEAAKVIENSQRDLNIAFVNELAHIFGRVGIDTHEVLAAAGSKWNFLPFKPGLVGGHCIGVDPYYLTHKAEKLGYHPQVILAGRRINDGMGEYIAEKTIKAMIARNIPVRGAKVGVLGLSFKENCPDVRNTRVVDILEELHSYSISTLVVDPVANEAAAQQEYGIKLADYTDLESTDVIIVAVAHHAFQNQATHTLLKHRKLVVDIKNCMDIQNKIGL